MEWVIGVVVVLVVVGILFGKKLKFVPGCGTGVPSPDLKDKKTDEIIRWQADSGTVTFHAGRQPIVVNVAECAADPKVQEKKALILQELGKK